MLLKFIAKHTCMDVIQLSYENNIYSIALIIDAKQGLMVLYIKSANLFHKYIPYAINNVVILTLVYVSIITASFQVPNNYKRVWGNTFILHLIYTIQCMFTTLYSN